MNLRCKLSQRWYQWERQTAAKLKSWLTSSGHHQKVSCFKILMKQSPVTNINLQYIAMETAYLYKKTFDACHIFSHLWPPLVYRWEPSMHFDTGSLVQAVSKLVPFCLYLPGFSSFGLFSFYPLSFRWGFALLYVGPSCNLVPHLFTVSLCFHMRSSPHIKCCS